MNCKSCSKQYSDNKNYLPRVLVNCGHTLCEECIERTFEDRQIECPQCKQISYGLSFHQYPINATVISLLRDEAVCRVHNQKLQAYCEKDNQLLCLSCVIGAQHKSHKISSVSQKVTKDRTILKQCLKSIQQSNIQIQQAISNNTQQIQRLQHEYKDYLLEIGLCFNHIRDVVKQIQDSYMSRVKTQYQISIERYSRGILEMKEKKQFMTELVNIYNQVMNLPNIQYLHQDNKRLFIIQNCKYRKSKIQPSKLAFNKINALNQVSSVVQDLIAYEKKLQGLSTPGLKQKKSNRNKEPTILQVNLNEQCKKHFKNNSNGEKQKECGHNEKVGQMQISSSTSMNAKHKKQKNHSINTNQNNLNNNSQISKTPKQNKSYVKKQAIAISATAQDQTNQKHNNSFHSQALPVSMINSFMESSLRSISIKGSQADFTMVSYEQRIFHFGGFNDSTVQFVNVDNAKNSRQLNHVNIQRSKAQCVIIPAYNPYSCLILGGKSANDKKLDSFIEYDLVNNKCVNLPYRLSQAKSGFGAVVKQSRLYIAGGSNSQKSLKTFEQYRILANSISKTDLPSMHYSRDEHCLVLGYDGYIYSCGGINESGVVLASCQRYNFSKNRWEKLASMNKPRRSFAMVSLPHGIYAIGGYDGGEYLKEVQLYDFTLEKWISVVAMAEPRIAHTAVVSNDLQSIVVSGGYYKKSAKTVQIFDVINEKWTDGPQMQSERFLHCSLIVNF